MIDSVTGAIEGRTVWEVADRVHEVGTGQRRSWSMSVRSNGLRMVDGIPSTIQRRAVWKVAHIIAKLEVCISILLETVLELAAVHGDSLAHGG